jgi:prepilin-type N-terminal cleavage/methylation domain-containing protein
MKTAGYNRQWTEAGSRACLSRKGYSAIALQFPASRIRSAALKPAFRARAFTLIELLVVIAVISLLAAMIFPITGAVTRNRIRSRTRAELEQLVTAIEAYKAKLGHYPPDNPVNVSRNQLYFELMGTTNNGTVYVTRDGSARIQDSPADFQAFLGPATTVNGFVNSTKKSSGDESRTAINFLPGGLKSTQVAEVTGQPVDDLKIIVCSILGPNNSLNPWRYNSSNPTNNPNSFDLWADVVINGKTNRISNWSREPLTVTQP